MVISFTLASSGQRCLLNILLYVRADTLAHADRAYTSLPQPAHVAIHLLQPYLCKGHHISTDRYYIGVPLAQVLLQKDTSFTGTMMKNRAARCCP